MLDLHQPYLRVVKTLTPKNNKVDNNKEETKNNYQNSTTKNLLQALIL